MKRLFLLLTLLSFPLAVGAADHFIRDGATGGSCTDWTTANACDNLPATLTRGDTYYIADGSYGAYTFNDAVSGTTLITIKKAIESDHGTSTGWLSSYGDGSADFTDWNFFTSYWEADGQVGQWADARLGVPAVPNFVAYGFRILKNTQSSGDKLIEIGVEATPVTNVTIRHTEMAYTNTPRMSGNWAQDQFIIIAWADDVLINFCWLHDAGAPSLILADASNFTMEFSVMERNGHAAIAEGFPPETEQGGPMHASNIGGDNHVFRYNIIRDWRSTGALNIHAEGAGITNFKVYGNWFTTTGYWASPSEADDENGVVSAVTATSGNTAFVYNNTFVDIDYGCTIMNFGSFTSRDIRNNIFYNCRTCSQSGGVCTDGDPVLPPLATHDFNWFFNSGEPWSETNEQDGTGDPFVNLSINDYHLAAATDAGDTTIGGEFDTDPDGLTRGADGTWDRGALEFVAGNPSTLISGSVKISGAVVVQ